jgi:TetR/AcrR family transcriptional repressor of lmrAB and yxaGH operons
MMRAVAGKKRGDRKAVRTAGPSPTPEERDPGTRGRMVEGAARLLARRGLQATSFSEVLEATGSPRGSVYHHFPDGKDQLVKAALDLVAAQMGAILDPREGAPAEEITELFLRVWRSILTRSQLQAGCAVVAVTVATDSRELLEHTAMIFRSWRHRLAQLLVKGGLAPAEAGPFAALLIAASEGAVILGRGEQSLEPFELVAAQLLDRVRELGRRR